MAVSCCWRGHGRPPRGSRRAVQGGLNPRTSCQRCRGCCPQANWDVLPSPQDGKLYWCDARTDKIERIDLETGENREVVLSSNNMDMFSVSVFEEYIYWSDRCGAKGAGGCVEGRGSQWVLWRGGKGPCAGHSVTPSSFRTHANGSIKRGNKDNATESVSLRTGIGVQLKDIKVFNRARQKGRSEVGGSSSCGERGWKQMHRHVPAAVRARSSLWEHRQPKAAERVHPALCLAQSPLSPRQAPTSVPRTTGTASSCACSAAAGRGRVPAPTGCCPRTA